MFDAKDAFDVGAPIDARTVGRLRDAKIRKFAFPRPQDVRLQLGQLADFLRAEDRTVGDDGGGHLWLHPKMFPNTR
jgi:hypothetical protein